MIYDDRFIVFFRSASAGGGAGIVTGLCVGWLECLKTMFQLAALRGRAMTVREKIAVLLDSRRWGSAARQTPSFAAWVAGLFALECSVNEEMREALARYFGKDSIVAIGGGIALSSACGGLFLAGADHMMTLAALEGISQSQALRVCMSRGPRVVFTGFAPMFLREAGFTSACSPR